MMPLMQWCHSSVAVHAAVKSMLLQHKKNVLVQYGDPSRMWAILNASPKNSWKSLNSSSVVQLYGSLSSPPGSRTPSIPSI